VIIFEKAMRGVDREGLAHFARRAQKLARIAGGVDILIADNGRLRELNRKFRRKNAATDVLSFPNAGGGDIAISGEIARKNASRYGHSPSAELKILILHGMLHLAGHDHDNDGGRMARLEGRLRARLNLPDSLIGRTLASPAQLRTNRPGQGGRSR
jgi:probable rRNA maturation factor